MIEIPKRLKNAIFNQITEVKKVPKDKSQFIIDLSANKITCTKCKGWVLLNPVLNGGHEVFSIEQVKANFKAKHLKICK